MKAVELTKIVEYVLYKGFAHKGVEISEAEIFEIKKSLVSDAIFNEIVGKLLADTKTS